MRLDAGGPTRQAARRRTAALAALSAAIHLAILTPLALTTSRLTPGAAPETRIVIPLDLVPAPASRAATARAQAAAAVPGGRRGEAVAGARMPAPRPADRPSARIRLPDAPAGAAAGAAAIPDPWRVRSGLGRPARLPCPAAPDNPLGQRLCAVGATPDHDPPPLTRADLLPNHDPAPGRRREAGFERQAEANEAWRSYTRDGGAYPGLRSLFSER